MKQTVDALEHGGDEGAGVPRPRARRRTLTRRRRQPARAMRRRTAGRLTSRRRIGERRATRGSGRPPARSGRSGGVRRRPCPLALLAACTGVGSATSRTTTPPPGPNTLTVLAGSELQDIVPILPRIERDTGLDLRFDYTGSLNGADQIAQGTPADLAWFSSGNYLTLAGASTKVLAKDPDRAVARRHRREAEPRAAVGAG